jgi:hypothetical protein
MKTTKIISAMTFAAALSCASPVFAGRRAGAAGGMAGTAGARSGSTMDTSSGQSNFGGNGFITAPLPRTGTDINRERERERELPNGVVEEQRQERRTNAAGQTQMRSQERTIQPNHPQASDQRARERSRTNGNMSERERERERELPNGVVEKQRQEQRTNATGQIQTRSQERTLAPHQ